VLLRLLGRAGLGTAGQTLTGSCCREETHPNDLSGGMGVTSHTTMAAYNTAAGIAYNTTAVYISAAGIAYTTTAVYSTAAGIAYNTTAVHNSAACIAHNTTAAYNTAAGSAYNTTADYNSVAAYSTQTWPGVRISQYLVNLEIRSAGTRVGLCEVEYTSRLRHKHPGGDYKRTGCVLLTTL
jgi:hypothetical protein